jgi:hypothetical protein
LPDVGRWAHRESIPDQPDEAGQGAQEWVHRELLFQPTQRTQLLGQLREWVPGEDVAGRWVEQPGAPEIRQVDLSECLAPEEGRVGTAQEATAVAARQAEHPEQSYRFLRRAPGAPVWQEWRWFD